MKKRATFLIVSAFLSAAGMAQDVIDNKNVRLGANAGRVVTLKEDMRIEDTGEGFYFKNPNKIRVSSRGNILIFDGQEQALHFDGQGRFLGNLFKKGQGPGEITHVLDIWSTSEQLLLLGYPSKILIFRLDGSLDKEIGLLGIPSPGEGFIFADAGRIFLRKTKSPDPKGGNGFIDIPNDIIEISARDSTAKTVFSFPLRVFVRVYETGAMSTTGWFQLQTAVLDNNTFVVNATPEYSVSVLDVNKGALARQFRRPYSRVKRVGGGGVSGSGGPAPAPPEFQNDIFALHIVDGKIWVQTSTVGEKGILFDVFDPQGRYLDHFFIQAASKDPSGQPVNRTLTIMNGSAYFREKTADDLIVIRKCRLVGL